MVYLNRILNEPTPQSEPLEGMVPNSAGGHAYPVDDMTRLHGGSSSWAPKVAATTPTNGS